MTVTITGTSLSGASMVAFNGTAASFTVNSATQIAATVPSAATTGKISVTTPGGSASSSASFNVTGSSSTLDLTIDGLYLTQSTQSYPTPAVPLIKDRSAWVRVFVKANEANNVAPQVRVRFLNGATTNTLTMSAGGTSVPQTVDPEDAAASWNAPVPTAWIQPGVQVVADVDPSGLIPETSKSNNQFTESPDVRTLKAWKMTLIPVHTGDGRVGGVENASRGRNLWVDFAKRLHPVPDAVDVTVGPVMNSSVGTLASSGTGWSSVLSELSAKRAADGVTDRYYYGVVSVNYSSGVAGLGYIGFPAAMGWDYSSGPEVLAHEVGHNFNRQHSPCGGASGTDPNYPYAGGFIGVPGWDVFAASNNLKTSALYTDIMGYCGTQWISDYVYKSELDFRAASPLGLVASPQIVNATNSSEGLLVWGRIEDGRMILEPAFRVRSTGVAPPAGPYTWEARDAAGRVVASASFDAPQMADLPEGPVRAFSLVVPMTSQALEASYSLRISQGDRELARQVRLAADVSGAADPVRWQELPEGGLQLYWNAGRHPVLMLRDAETGEVRGFLRGGNAQIENAPADLEIHFSDGVRSEVIRYRRSRQ
jgi:hypothetical protein